ncbi:MAG: M23 family metallopeptidase [Rikenellaceae bacterium]|nr:M23 family metallopeptidase [Rikenellaceae bacterium]
MKKYFLAILTLLAVGTAYGISATDFIPPVDYQMYLAGNVGEYRSNHFHSGIDIKTEGVTGKPIYSVADGYISRIAVSPTGYGYCLYVNHPNGTTSVYGHLERFNDRIEEYVVDQQYKRKSFNVDLYLSRWQIPVEQGEIIAYSGNSGSSAGPHLHFEIRDQTTQDPLNFLALGYMDGIEDSMAPRFLKLYVYNFTEVDGHLVIADRTVYDVESLSAGYRVTSGPVKTGNIYAFAVEVTDRKRGSDNTLGIYSLEQKIDGRRNFGFTIDKFSFSETRYANDYVDYGPNRTTRNEIIKCFVSPNNKLSIYKNVADRGILRGEGAKEVEITITDDAGCASTLRFTTESGAEEPLSAVSENAQFVRWDRDFNYDLNNLKVYIPAGMMYISNYMEFAEESGPKNSLSPMYTVGDPDKLTPLHAAMTLTIKTDSIPAGLSGKLCAATLAPNGSFVYEGGTERGYSVVISTRTFGKYFITYDTIPPKIVPEFTNGADLSGSSKLSLKITDDLSGIKEYSATIDGEWALFEYDKKSNRITHYFRNRRYGRGGSHTLSVTVTDNKGNRTTENYKFTY